MYPETGYKCKLQLLPYNCKVRLNAHVLFTYAKFNISAVVSIYAVLLPSFSVTFLRKLLSMLSKQQKLLLAQLIRDHKMIVLAPFSSKVMKKAKQEALETIRTLKRRWGEHRQRQNPQRRSVGQYSPLYT